MPREVRVPVKRQNKKKKKKKKRKKLPSAAVLRATVDAMRAAVPNQRAVDALEGVLDAVEGEVPEGLRDLAPVMRAGMALLLGIGSQGGKSFGVDTGDGVAVLVRPVDTQAVAMRAMGAFATGIFEKSTRELAKEAFKEKLAADRAKKVGPDR